MEFSFFANGIGQTVPTSNITIEEFLAHIQSGKWAEQIRALRTLSEKKDIDKAKKALPYVCVSGVFAKRAEEHLLAHSGLLQIDIDKLGENTKKELRLRLEADAYILACWDSPTNTGLKCLLSIEPTAEHHAQAFLYAEHYFLSKYGIAIDKSCKDVCRAMFVSYDKSLYANANAQRFDYVPFEVKGYEQYKQEFAQMAQQKNEKYHDVFALCENWVGKKYSYVDGQKAYFRFSLACLLCEFGVSQSEATTYILSHYPSASGEKKVRQEIESAYKKCQFAKRVFTPTPTTTREKPTAKEKPKPSHPENETDWEGNLPEDLPEDQRKCFRRFGFYEWKNCLYVTERSQIERVSNFTIRILFLIQSKSTPKRVVELRNEYSESVLIDLPTSMMTTVGKFKEAVESEGNFLFEGTDKHLNKLKRKLMAEEKPAKEITTLGYQRDGDFWAWGNGIFAGGQYVESDGYGIANYQNKCYFLPAFSRIYQYDDANFENEKRFVYKKSKIVFADWARLFCKVYAENQNGRIGILFFIASLFRDVVQSQKQAFPILNIFGVPQTGKSSFSQSLLYLFGDKQEGFMLGNAGTTKGFVRKFSQFRNGFVWLDEYKNSLPLKTIEAIKNVWDGVGYERAKMTQDSKTQSMPILSACLLSGQELPTADSALTSRCIMSTFKKTTFTEEESNEYNSLKELQQEGFSSITHEILALREIFASTFKTTFEKAFRDLQASIQADDRILFNHAVLLTTFRIVAPHLALPFTEAQLLPQLKEMIAHTTSLMGTANDVQKFWDTIAYLYADAKIKEGEDFLIKNGHLFIRLTRIYPLYMEAFNRQTGFRGMEKTSLIQYLRASKAFVEFKDNYRFGQSVTSAFVFDMSKMSISIGEYQAGASPEELQKNSDLPPW